MIAAHLKTLTLFGGVIGLFYLGSFHPKVIGVVGIGFSFGFLYAILYQIFKEEAERRR